jgi:hypothetical protein
VLRAVHPAGSGWRQAFSPELLVRVAPVVRLGRTPVRAVRGGAVRVRGQVTPRKRVVYQVLQQRIGGSYRRVGVRAVGARSGRFRSWFAPAFTGYYRVYVVAKPDAATARGRSVPHVVRVLR